MKAIDLENPADALEQLADEIEDTAGRRVKVLFDDPAVELARQNHCTLRDIYIAALKRNIVPYRYTRNYNSISIDDQITLAQSRVAVIGSGGLGGHVILTLARIGIGYLKVIDFDKFDESNLNRQAVSTMAAIGDFKSESAARMVAGINPAVETTPVTEKIDTETAGSVLKGAHVVVDALDNIDDRLTLEKIAGNLDIPLVHGALAGFEGQVMTIFPGDPGLKLIYGEKTDRKDNVARPEAVLGVPAPTPAAVATMQSMEVLKILLKRKNILRHKMLHIDLESGQLNTFHFKD